MPKTENDVSGRFGAPFTLEFLGVLSFYYAKSRKNKKRRKLYLFGADSFRVDFQNAPFNIGEVVEKGILGVLVILIYHTIFFINYINYQNALTLNFDEYHNRIGRFADERRKR